MNLTLALPDTLREVAIDGVSFVLVRKSALEALYSTGGGDRPKQRPPTETAADRAYAPNRQSRPQRAASARTPRPPEKMPKAPAVAAAAEVSRPVNGALRGAVLAEIQQNPGRTSLELYDTISAKFPSATSGSTYTAIKSWVAKGDVEGRSTEAGPKGWYPVRSARKAAGGNTGTPKSPTPLSNAPGILPPTPERRREARLNNRLKQPAQTTGSPTRAALVYPARPVHEVHELKVRRAQHDRGHVRTCLGMATETDE